MTPTRSRRRELVFLAAIVGTPVLLRAGPLASPLGPVTSTGETTQEVFDQVAIAEPQIPVNGNTTAATPARRIPTLNSPTNPALPPTLKSRPYY